jgi:hypothetical protein
MSDDLGTVVLTKHSVDLFVDAYAEDLKPFTRVTLREALCDILASLDGGDPTFLDAYSILRRRAVALSALIRLNSAASVEATERIPVTQCRRSVRVRARDAAGKSTFGNTCGDSEDNSDSAIVGRCDVDAKRSRRKTSARTGHVADDTEDGAGEDDGTVTVLCYPYNKASFGRFGATRLRVVRGPMVSRSSPGVGVLKPLSINLLAS